MISVRSEVQVFPGPPFIGGVAQLGERLLCKQEVIGSIPFASTNTAQMNPVIARHARLECEQQFRFKDLIFVAVRRPLDGTLFDIVNRSTSI